MNQRNPRIGLNPADFEQAGDGETLTRGTLPAGVTVPCGVISATFRPRTPRPRARSTPESRPIRRASALSSDPTFMCFCTVATWRFRRAGSMPRISDGLLISPLTQSPSPARTAPRQQLQDSFCRTQRCQASRSSASVSPAEALDFNVRRWRQACVRAARLKPFITEITMMSAATPSAMPSMEISEMNEMKAVAAFGAHVAQAKLQLVAGGTTLPAILRGRSCNARQRRPKCHA